MGERERDRSLKKDELMIDDDMTRLWRGLKNAFVLSIPIWAVLGWVAWKSWEAVR
jgi:hypothetical protein